tara:strand:- start:60220 stop:60585 length:366 start_codon:yes stop_codon:yes gene_type:complete
MLRDEFDFLPNRLNYDPVVFKGCSAKEIVYIALFWLALSLPLLMVTVQILFGAAIFGAAAGIVVMAALTYLTCTVFEKLKRGQEKGYLQQLFVLKMERKRLLPNTGLIRRTGAWFPGRYLR